MQSVNGAADVEIKAFVHRILKKIEQSENGAVDVQINAFLTESWRKLSHPRTEP